MSSETGTGGMQANCLKLTCFPLMGNSMVSLQTSYKGRFFAKHPFFDNIIMIIRFYNDVTCVLINPV